MERRIFAVGSLLVGVGVGLGAFGAHALRAVVEPRFLTIFETGVRYQVYHGLALLALAWAVGRWPDRKLVPAAWLLGAGTVVFSGSLYLLVMTGRLSLGAVTPIGGVSMILGWALVAWRMVAPDTQEGG